MLPESVNIGVLGGVFGSLQPLHGAFTVSVPLLKADPPVCRPAAAPAGISFEELLKDYEALKKENVLLKKECETIRTKLAQL